MPVLEIHSPALAMGVLLLAGYVGGRMARRFRLPAVAGYVLAGVLMGPSVFKIIPDATNTALSPLKDFGVGMVAMVIGSELVWKKMRHLGWSIFIISIGRAHLRLGASMPPRARPAPGFDSGRRRRVGWRSLSLTRTAPCT